jgi:hypothetical protein
MCRSDGSRNTGSSWLRTTSESATSVNSSPSPASHCWANRVSGRAGVFRRTWMRIFSNREEDLPYVLIFVAMVARNASFGPSLRIPTSGFGQPVPTNSPVYRQLGRVFAAYRARASPRPEDERVADYKDQCTSPLAMSKHQRAHSTRGFLAPAQDGKQTPRFSAAPHILSKAVTRPRDVPTS